MRFIFIYPEASLDEMHNLGRSIQEKYQTDKSSIDDYYAIFLTLPEITIIDLQTCTAYSFKDGKITVAGAQAF